MSLLKFYNEVETKGMSIYNIDTEESKVNGYAVALSKNIVINSVDELTDYVRNHLNLINYYLIAIKKSDGIHISFFNILENKQEALLEAFKSNLLSILDTKTLNEIKLPKPQISGTYWQNESYMRQWISKQ